MLLISEAGKRLGLCAITLWGSLPSHAIQALLVPEYIRQNLLRNDRKLTSTDCCPRYNTSMPEHQLFGNTVNLRFDINHTSLHRNREVVVGGILATVMRLYGRYSHTSEGAACSIVQMYKLSYA